jgi:O-antigen/teichoic acid export membrane protein
MGVATGLMVILDAGVFSYGYPELIRMHHTGDHSLAIRRLRHMLYQTIAVSATFTIVTWLLLPVILSWIGNPYYLSKISMFPYIMFAMFLLALSQVPHWGLYAQGRDKPIIVSQFAGLATFMVSAWFTRYSLGTYSVLLGLNAAFGVILFWKSAVYLAQVRRLRSE